MFFYRARPYVAGVALMALGGALVLVLVARDAAALCVPGVSLGDIYVRFTWQAWRNVTSTFVLRGRRGTYGTGWRAWAGFSRPWRRGNLRGRRGTWWHLRSFHVTGVAQCHIHLRFAWQAWHLVTSTFVSRGRRGAMSHPPSFCVAGVALMALGGALGLVLVARDAAALCVAGVALGDIYVRFTWQAWHNVTSTFVLRGRRGTYGTGWRAWAGFSRPWRRGTLCGRRGTWSHLRWFHAACVALGHIYGGFTWHAWRNLTSTFVLRGKCGTIFDTPSFTHHFVTHHISHTIFHTQLCHPPSFTHHLSHTTLSPTIFDTPSFTHNFVTHTHTPSFTHHFVTHHLWHTLFHTPSL